MTGGVVDRKLTNAPFVDVCCLDLGLHRLRYPELVLLCNIILHLIVCLVSGIIAILFPQPPREFASESFSENLKVCGFPEKVCVPDAWLCPTMSRCVVTHNGSTPHGALQATLSVVVHRTPCGGNSSKLQATITPVLAKYKSPPPDYPKLVRAMSSKSPRSTDQLMFRSQTLPTEIQEVCIDFVATGLEVVADAHQWLRTLRCCALTCRAWLPRARFYLFQSVVFTTLGELHRFVAAIPSRLHPGAQHVQGVDSNQRFTSTSVDKSPWRFTHLVPHYLANRLSQVVWLRLCEDGNKTAAFHRSFLMELSQFHAVKHLTLANYEFALFTDIHRLVASLKGLVTISLAEVHWDERPPKSLIRGTLWKVREVNLRNCTSLSSGVYLWTLPPPNALPPSFRGSKDENSHPAFTLHDAEIIKETVDLFSLSGSGSYTHTLKWECASQSGWCE